MNCHIFLTGFMGTGKTTVGKVLARKLGRKFIDADLLVEEKMKMSISDIFSRHGEERFRDEETRVLKELINYSQGLLVVSLGGGAVLKKENLDMLKSASNALAVNLYADMETLWQRLKNQDDRPLLKNDNPKETIQDLLEERKGYYEEIPLQVKTDSLSPEEVAEKVLLLTA